MRLLVVIPHYCAGSASSLGSYGSSGPRLPRLAGLSEMIQSLFAHFGPRRIASRTARAAAPPQGANVLDVVIVTVRGANVLDEIELDPEIEVEYFDGDPIMLMFEAQRLLQERAGQYDIYGMMEDDLIIHAPLFFDKIDWFQSAFPGKAVLAPHRYEISKSGRIEKLLFEPAFRERPAPFVRAGQVEHLSGKWRGQDLAFELAGNPHAGCYFVSDQQLTAWITTEWFYDRDPSWIGPLESAADLALGRAFDIYKPVERQSNFLEVEHFGTRFANLQARVGSPYRNAVLYGIAEEALSKPTSGRATGGMVSDHRADNDMLRQEVLRMGETLGSRSKLFLALVNAIIRKR